jgi:hypothetical protein
VRLGVGHRESIPQHDRRSQLKPLARAAYHRSEHQQGR